MDSGIVDLIFKGVLALAQLALFIYVRNTNRNDEVDRRFVRLQETQDAQGAALGADIGQLSTRMAHMETAIGAAPTHGDLGDIYAKVGVVDSKVSTQSGKLDAIDATVRMILSRITERGMP